MRREEGSPAESEGINAHALSRPSAVHATLANNPLADASPWLSPESGGESSKVTMHRGV